MPSGSLQAARADKESSTSRRRPTPKSPGRRETPGHRRHPAISRCGQARATLAPARGPVRDGRQQEKARRDALQHAERTLAEAAAAHEKRWLTRRHGTPASPNGNCCMVRSGARLRLRRVCS